LKVACKMKCAVVQFDTRKDHAFQELVDQNIEYCKGSGAEHVMATGGSGIPPYWGKVRACLAVAESGNYDAALFLDTDAVVMDFSMQIGDLLKEGVIFTAGGNAKFNAGAFAVRCNQDGVSFLKEWMSCYRERDWELSGSKWKCLNGGWAGIAYEQGSLNELIVPKYKDSVATAGWETFLHCDSIREKPDDLYVPDFQKFANAMRRAGVVHFCGQYKVLIPVRKIAREGRLALFDARDADQSRAMQDAAAACRDGGVDLNK